jgi:formate hydrogenlyase subunit 6/NADH:ubiquinone oxidoreductase subunit I
MKSRKGDIFMGHINGKDIYRKLGDKIDNLTMRTPWNKTLHAILSELYTTNEADVIVKMPYGLSNIDRIQKVTKYERSQLQNILDDLCSKGLIIDLWIKEEYYYMPSPMVIGIFEFTMMRTGDKLNTKKWAELFHKYLQGDDSFYAANCKHGEHVNIARTLPHEETIKKSDYVEVMDYEKAVALIENFDKFGIGLCSCRHEKFHVGEKKCDVPLNTCSTFGGLSAYLIRHNFAKEVSKTEMLENLARSKEMRLVLNADNVQKDITFLCHCCKCCCNLMLGINKYGYANTIVTSSLIAETDDYLCIGCSKCAKACPINAIKMAPAENVKSKKKKPITDTSFCLGCGVCAFDCAAGARKLVKRGKRVIHPETTFERVILQCLERGTLQNQIFDNPESISQQFMRGFIGGFLKLSLVKRALMSDMLRSLFLDSMKKGVQMQGRGWLTQI